MELKSSGRAHSEEEEIQKTPPKTTTIQGEAACSQLYFNRHHAASLTVKYSDTVERNGRLKIMLIIIIKILAAMVPTTFVRTLSWFASWEWAASTGKRSSALQRVWVQLQTSSGEGDTHHHLETVLFNCAPPVYMHRNLRVFFLFPPERFGTIICHSWAKLVVGGLSDEIRWKNAAWCRALGNVASLW